MNKNIGKPFKVYDKLGRAWNCEYIACPVCRGVSYGELFRVKKYKCPPNKPEDTFVKCIDCGLVYINPQMLFELEPVKEMSPTTLVDLNIVTNTRLLDFELKEDLERIQKYKPTGHILEIGCSTGAFLSLAAEVGYQTTGVEPNSEHAAYARDRFGLNVIQGFVAEQQPRVQLPADAFDIVVIIAVIEHVLNVRDFIYAIHRSLRHNGILYLVTPDVNSLNARLQGRHWDEYHVGWHHQFFSKYTLRRLLTDHRFQILETWGVYRGRPIFLKQMIKKVLKAIDISYDVICVLAEKVN